MKTIISWPHLSLYKFVSVFVSMHIFTCFGLSAAVHRERHRSALILGAGPAGLAAALGLSKICEQVYLVEKKPSFRNQGAVFGLAVNGQKALNELCPPVMQQLEALGCPMSNNTLLMLWWEMRDALLRQVRETANIQLMTGEEFIDINDTADNVIVSFRSGLVLTADMLIGADGVHSSLREWLGLPPFLPTENRIFRGSLTVSNDSSEAFRRLLENDLARSFDFPGAVFLLFNFNSKRPGKLAWGLSITRDIEETDTPLSILSKLDMTTADRQLWKEIFENSERDHMKLPIRKVADFSAAALRPFKGRWGGRGRVALIGDAAHAMRATTGQGGSQAFEDAVMLTRTLASEHSVPKALHDFEVNRLL